MQGRNNSSISLLDRKPKITFCCGSLKEKKWKEFSDTDPAQRVVKGMAYSVFSVLHGLLYYIIKRLSLHSTLASLLLARGTRSYLLQSQTYLESF